jgi:hypothetical protein
VQTRTAGSARDGNQTFNSTTEKENESWKRKKGLREIEWVENGRANRGKAHGTRV